MFSLTHPLCVFTESYDGYMWLWVKSWENVRLNLVCILSVQKYRTSFGSEKDFKAEI